MWHAMAASAAAVASVYSEFAALMVLRKKPLTAGAFMCCAAGVGCVALTVFDSDMERAWFWLTAALTTTVLAVGLWPCIAESFVCPLRGHKPALRSRIDLNNDRTTTTVETGVYCAVCKERVGD